MLTTFDIRDHVVVVTGASGGIGRGIVDHLLDAGADVAAVARTAARAAELRADLGDRTNVSVHAADLRDVSTIEPLFAEIDDRLSTLRATVTTGGANGPGRVAGG